MKLEAGTNTTDSLITGPLIYFCIYRYSPLHTHDYLISSIRNIRVATDEGPSPKLALSEGGSR